MSRRPCMMTNADFDMAQIDPDSLLTPARPRLGSDNVPDRGPLSDTIETSEGPLACETFDAWPYAPDPFEDTEPDDLYDADLCDREERGDGSEWL